MTEGELTLEQFLRARLAEESSEDRNGNGDVGLLARVLAATGTVDRQRILRAIAEHLYPNHDDYSRVDFTDEPPWGRHK